MECAGKDPAARRGGPTRERERQSPPLPASSKAGQGNECGPSFSGCCAKDPQQLLDLSFAPVLSRESGDDHRDIQLMYLGEHPSRLPTPGKRRLRHTDSVREEKVPRERNRRLRSLGAAAKNEPTAKTTDSNIKLGAIRQPKSAVRYLSHAHLVYPGSHASGPLRDRRG